MVNLTWPCWTNVFLRFELYWLNWLFSDSCWIVASRYEQHKLTFSLDSYWSAMTDCLNFEFVVD